jgi:hypothetical protein
VLQTDLMCAVQFRKLGYEAVDMICEYMKTVPEARVVPDVQVSALVSQHTSPPSACSGAGQALRAGAWQNHIITQGSVGVAAPLL